MTDSLIAWNDDSTGTNDIGIQLAEAIEATGNTTHNTVQGNIIANKNRYGINLYGGTSTQLVTNNNILGNTVYNIRARPFNGVNGNGMCIYNVAADYTEIGYNTLTNCLIGRVDQSLPLGSLSISDSYQVKSFFNTITTSLWGGEWWTAATRFDPAGLGHSSVGDTISATGTYGVLVDGIPNMRFSELKIYNAGTVRKAAVIGGGVVAAGYSPTGRTFGF